MKKIFYSICLILSTLITERIFIDHSPHAEIVNMHLQGVDGYAFEVGKIFKRNIKLKIVLHPSITDLQIAGMNPRLAAFTYPDKKGVCEVHIVDPRSRYEPEYLGHELFHCIYNDWHPSIK